jgi:hypothetical protein
MLHLEEILFDKVESLGLDEIAVGVVLLPPCGWCAIFGILVGM